MGCDVECRRAYRAEAHAMACRHVGGQVSTALRGVGYRPSQQRGNTERRARLRRSDLCRFVVLYTGTLKAEEEERASSVLAVLTQLLEIARLLHVKICLPGIEDLRQVARRESVLSVRMGHCPSDWMLGWRAIKSVLQCPAPPVDAAAGWALP